MTAAYGKDTRMLKDHGDRFVCVLYRRAKRMVGRSIDSMQVYEGIRMEGFTDMEQAAKELVRFLVGERPRRIESESDEDYRRVKLTLDGLINLTDQECDKTPYTNYV